MNPKTTRLRKIMADHGLKSPDVARMLNRKTQTVRLWRSDNERSIPSDALELLEIRIRRESSK